MNKKLWILLAVSLVLSVSLFLAACAKEAPPATSTPTPAAAQKPTAEAPQYGGVLKVIVDSPISMVGAPAEAWQSPNARYVGPCMEQLVYLDLYQGQPRVVPGLVESWDTAPDGKSITFHLRKSVKFHDGTDFNAEAVKYNLQAVSAIPPGAVLRSISSYDVVDEYTLRLNLKQYDGLLLLRLASANIGSIVSPTAAKITTTAETRGKDHVVGTGPFKFASFKLNDSVTYVKADSYWQKGRPYLDGFQFISIADEVTRTLGFKGGQAQVLNQISPATARDFASRGCDVRASKVEFIFSLIPDGANSDSPFSDKRVREAVEYAIDKKAISDAIGLGYYDAAYVFATPKSERSASGLQPRSYDVAKAKQLLASAGHPNGFQTQIIADTTTKKDVLVAVQTYLKEINIDASIDVADLVRFQSVQSAGWKNALLMPGTPMQPIMPSNIGLTSFFGTPQSNVSMFRPAGWQDKFNALNVQSDDAKRLAQIRELEKAVSDEAMAIPIFATPTICVTDGTVRDFDWGDFFLFDWSGSWLSKATTANYGK